MLKKLMRSMIGIAALLLLLIGANVLTALPVLNQNQTVTTQKKNTKEEASTSLGDIFKLLFGDDDDLFSDEEVLVEEKESETEEYVEYFFRNKKYLSQHFEKHGEEFKGLYKTEEEYEKGASDVVNNKDALHKLESEDEDDIYYLEETNEFVVVSKDGYIRTYFKPSAGKKYFDRQ